MSAVPPPDPTPIEALFAAYDLAAPPLGSPGEPTFSVIVRTQGRRPESLVEALDSIAAQDRAAAETIVVVHGTEAVRDEVAAALADRPGVRVLGVEGGGRARPLNAGFDAAASSHVCVLDDDDLVMPHWLSSFADAIDRAPTSVVRAVTLSQPWSTDGSEQPRRATGPVERPFPVGFDLLAHMSVNLTPICSLAFPRAPLGALGVRFDEDLAVFEDWDFLMRAAMALGVVSIPAETSLYRRLDHGNADTVEDEGVWRATHSAVIDRLSARPVLLPPGDARRLAGAHFEIGGGSRHEAELRAAQGEVDALTRSPVRALGAFARRAVSAIRHRTAARRP